MTDQDRRRSTAYHEAGHAVVAWVLGLSIEGIAIGIDGDETKGHARIQIEQDHLSQLDQLAICLAGIEAQEAFQCALTHDFAWVSDFSKADEIIGEDAPEEQRQQMIESGHRRARELIVLHEAKVVRLATRLVACGVIELHELNDLVKD